MGNVKNEASNEAVKKKNCVFQLRLSDDEAALLEMLSFKTDKSKSDVIRKALDLYNKATGNGYSF